MKLNKFFMGILGALALTACSSEENIPDQPVVIDESLSRYMAVTIKNANPGTRAGGDQSGDLFEEGLTPENDVKTIRFYFFDAEGNGRAVKANGTNFIDIAGDDTSVVVPEKPSMPNVEKILTAVLAISTKEGDNVESLKSVVAIVNGENLPGNPVDKQLVKLSELRSLVDNYDVAGGPNKAYNSSNLKDIEKPFLMTSSVYGSEQFNCEVEIKPTDLKSTTDEALKNPVDVYVERVLAKVRLSFKWNNDFADKISEVTFDNDNNKYIAVKLTDKEGKNYTSADGKQVYVIFTGWGLQTVANMSHMFKNVNSSWDLGWKWSDPDSHRSYWALNPATDNKRKDFALVNFKHSQSTTGKIGTQRQSGAGETLVNYNGDFFYCQENAGDDAELGWKKLAKLDQELSNRTQAYLGARLVTIDNGVATSLDIAEWGGKKYITSDLLKAMLGAVNDQIYTRKEDGTETVTKEDGSTEITTKYKYESITLDDIELVEEEHTVGVDENSSVNTVQNGKRYISRIQLKKSSINTEYYNAKHEKYANSDEVNKVLKTAGVARVWGDGNKYKGLTYYFVDLNHFAKTSDDNSNPKYGVVRNHIYDVQINSVYGLGTPILTPADGSDKEVIIKPEKPGDDETFLGVQMYILSWRVVNQGVSLDW